ncbi:MAG TPA: rhomboid family intramembrane serine protease [Candidatus Avalokitesvara rifleensis]|uniref:rhomboid family intramembrane serine protease n=1 Tax=Candidatus Avalokitesvara rifleensis TaxID=3367620 RepID=UPI00402A526B
MSFRGQRSCVSSLSDFSGRLSSCQPLWCWFVIQFFNGAAAFTSTTDAGGGVAWWAHIGGFVCGMVLILLVSKIRFPAIKTRWHGETASGDGV